MLGNQLFYCATNDAAKNKYARRSEGKEERPSIMYIPYFIYLSILETAPRNDVSMTSWCHPITDIIL